jgi:osmotically-inducible protein OsmY
MKSILHQAEDKLSESSHYFARTVRCEYSQGVLKISGRVPSFYLKQTAQALVQGIAGVNRIENRLVVANPAGVSGDKAILQTTA